MTLEGITVSDISQKEEDKYCMILHVESKRKKKQRKSRLVVARSRGVIEMGEGGQNVRTFIYEMIMIWGSNEQYDDSSYNTVLCIWKFLKE